MTTITITIDRAVVEQALHVAEHAGYPLALIKALRAALAQEQAEQTWVCPEAPEERAYSKPGHCENCGKPLVLAQEQAEPVQEPAFHGFMSADGTQVDLCFTPSAPRSDGTYATAYYTAPPKLVPLTDEEFDALCEANSFGAVARGQFPLIPRAMLKALVDAAIERAHGIGDNT